jgi:hypothetical protein
LAFLLSKQIVRSLLDNFFEVICALDKKLAIKKLNIPSNIDTDSLESISSSNNPNYSNSKKANTD